MLQLGVLLWEPKPGELRVEIPHASDLEWMIAHEAQQAAESAGDVE